MQAGNGGWAGSIPARILAGAVARGYATAGTNGGHDAAGANGPAGWAIGAVAAPFPTFTGSSWFQGWDIAKVELVGTVSATIAIASPEIPSAI